MYYVNPPVFPLSKGVLMSKPNIDILSERLKEAATLEEYRRIQCVYLKAKHGYPSKQIAEITTYHPASVRRIQSQYRRD